MTTRKHNYPMLHMSTTSLSLYYYPTKNKVRTILVLHPLSLPSLIAPCPTTLCSVQYSVQARQSLLQSISQSMPISQFFPNPNLITDR